MLVVSALSAAGLLAPELVKLGVTCGAGATGALCFYPIDLVKTRMQSSAGARFDSSWEAAQQVVASEGPLGLYNGLPVQLAGIMPVVAVQLITNDALRELCHHPFLQAC